jgi:NAD(P)-dependent dehydrogenase (short-subunit alcohol dehydrogenase family)
MGRVIGAGKRIGRAIAKRLGELGYDLALHYNGSVAKLPH